MLAGLLLAAQHRRVQDPHVRYHRFDLPAFDAYAYVAMAEQPAFFTLAPWGYRVLTPWLARVLPGPNVLRGFRALNLAAVGAAAVLLFLFLRRLGLATAPSLAGLAAFLLSPPVTELVKNPFLADASTLALESAFVLAVEAGAGIPALALISALGALSKESFFLFVPLVYLARRSRDGEARALAGAAVALAAGLAAALVLRGWWTPHLRTPVPALQADTLRAAGQNLAAFLSRQAWGRWYFAGLALAATAAAMRAPGRLFLARYGYVLVAATAAPFFNPVVFSPGDVRRLLVHALPSLVPLALLAAWPVKEQLAPDAARARVPWFPAAAALAAVAVIAAPLLVADRYRRADFGGRRDGPLVLAFCRDSLRTARRLERGEAVNFDPESRRFEWGVSDPGELERMRWFLREGWGDTPHYGTGEIVMQAPEATLVLPCLTPRDLRLTLEMRAPSPRAGAVLVNGRPVGAWHASPAGEAASALVPASTLFRGDNLVTLAAAAGVAAPVRLARLTVAPAGP